MRIRNRGDNTAPQLQQTTPAENATNVAVNANLILTFNEAVKAGTGNIEIRNAADGSLVQSIAVTDTSKVSFAGSQMTINPGNDLSPETNYYVTFAAGVVRDLASNAFAGISSAAVFSFATESDYIDTTAPVILFASPDGYLTGGENAVITFNEPVKAGSGVIKILNAADDSVYLTISVNDQSQVSFSGRNVIINPTNDLPPGSYYIAIAPTAFEDLYGNDVDDSASAAAEAWGVVAVASGATGYGANAIGISQEAFASASARAVAGSAYAVANALVSVNATATGGDLTDLDGYGAPEDLIAGNDASLDVSTMSLAAAFNGKVVFASSNQVDVLGTDGLTYRFFGSNFYIINGNHLSSGTDISLIEVWSGFGTSAHILYSHYPDAPGLYNMQDLDIAYRLSGNNTIIGSSDDDTLFGFEGDDALVGRAGDDEIDGGTGGDEIWGGLGDDSLEGDSGFDAFKFASLAELDGDVIVDFEGGDTIDLSAIVGLSFIGSAAFSGIAGQVRYAWVSGSTVLQIDSDGDGVSNAALLLGGGEVSLAETAPGSRVLLLTNDVTAPLLVSTAPADNAVNVSVQDLITISMTFNENVMAGSGLIEIRLSSDHSLVGTVDVAEHVDFDGRRASFQFDGVIDPTTGYYITLAPGVIKDLAGNNYAGISSSTTFNFTSGDFVAPQLVSTTPVDNATGVAPNANIVLTFDETVVPLSGSISINRSSDNTQVATFSVVGDSRVTFSGNTVTLDPNVDLAPGESYYVQIYPGRIADLSGNLFAGITTTQQFNFTTINNPGLVLTGNSLSNTLVGGAGNDTITGLGNKDTLTGAAGSDTFVYGAVSQSTSRNYDTITDFNASADVLDLWFQVTGVDASISGGSLGARRFDSDLASAVTAAKLAAHHAVLYTPNSGLPTGSKLLIVDANGIAGYQAGADLVILVGANSTNLGSLTAADFV